MRIDEKSVVSSHPAQLPSVRRETGDGRQPRQWSVVSGQLSVPARQPQNPTYCDDA